MNVMQPVFVVDGMLGSLARKLRMFGFDTLYYNDAEDKRLIEIGLKESRVLLTGDRALFQRAMKMGLNTILLNGVDEVDDLAHILQGLDIASIKIVSEKSRCPMCNEPLETSDRNSMKDYVPAGVLDKHSEFYFCKKCSKAYWEGSHFRKLEEFERNVNSRLNKIES
ncbi:MAG: Mut7-C RNAse domain-containing protein [Nitrososphaerales archaeon]